MHVVILGAGIAGVTTAWQLLKDGHAVTVIDREDGPARFTSFGNAGLIAPGHAYAWSSPKAPGMMWRSLISGDQAIRFKPQFSLRQWRWVKAFLGECNTQSATRNTKVKAGLCAYSQEMLQEVVSETGVTYDKGSGGIVYFFRTPDVFRAAAEKSKILSDLGIPQEVLTRDETIARDPGLAHAADEITGSVFAPTDESGDCHLFTNALAERCAKEGATFRYGVTIDDLELTDGAVSAVVTNTERIEADAFVLCLGVYSPHLVEKLGINLPIYPVKGYSMTVPMTDPAKGPRLGGVDEENLLAYCPMGKRLRITATAEIAGYSTAHTPADFRKMTERARVLFGHVADFDNASHWAGLRPMTPTGAPVIDRSPIENLWLNTGHGHMGWTMSNGSARILADLVGQRTPSHPREGLEYEPA